jgi:ribonuclease HII
MTYLIGIDDAGRGPTLGPMILAGVLIKKEDEIKLKQMGAKDSKLLSPTRRKLLSEEIKKLYKYHAEITSPKEIDDCDNLNDLEAIKAAMIINHLADKIKDDIEVIIDCPSVNIKAWNSFVEKLVINKKIKIVSEHKADFNHPVVSAASIIAKETREDEIAKLKQELKR